MKLIKRIVTVLTATVCVLGVCVLTACDLGKNQEANNIEASGYIYIDGQQPLFIEGQPSLNDDEAARFKDTITASDIILGDELAGKIRRKRSPYRGMDEAFNARLHKISREKSSSYCSCLLNAFGNKCVVFPCNRNAIATEKRLFLPQKRLHFSLDDIVRDYLKKEGLYYDT